MPYPSPNTRTPSPSSPDLVLRVGFAGKRELDAAQSETVRNRLRDVFSVIGWGERTRPRVPSPAPSPETCACHPGRSPTEASPPGQSAAGARGRPPEHARARVLPPTSSSPMTSTTSPRTPSPPLPIKNQQSKILNRQSAPLPQVTCGFFLSPYPGTQTASVELVSNNSSPSAVVLLMHFGNSCLPNLHHPVPCHPALAWCSASASQGERNSATRNNASSPIRSIR